MYELAKELYFLEKVLGNKTTSDKSPMKQLKSPDVMASGISTNILPEDPNELCDRIKVLLQEKQARNNSNKGIEEIIPKIDKFLEYKCISTKQDRLLLKCLN